MGLLLDAYYLFLDVSGIYPAISRRNSHSIFRLTVLKLLSAFRQKVLLDAYTLGSLAIRSKSAGYF